MESNPIPKILHQIWWQGQANLPITYQQYQMRWKEIHSDFQYELWDEDRLKRLIETFYNDFYKVWKHLPHMIQKIDAGKLILLHRYGGVLADMDMVPSKHIGHLLDGVTLVLSQCYVHPFGIMAAKTLGLTAFSKTKINNAFIAVTPFHPVMELSVKMLHDTALLPATSAFGVYIAKTCGPEVLAEAFLRITSALPNLKYRKYSEKWFEPKISILYGTPQIHPETHVLHMSTRSWIRDNPVATFQLTLFITIIVVFIVVVSVSIAVGIHFGKRAFLKKNKHKGKKDIGIQTPSVSNQ